MNTSDNIINDMVGEINKNLIDGIETNDMRLLSLSIKSLEDFYNHDHYKESIEDYNNYSYIFYNILHNACLTAVRNKSKNGLKELWYATHYRHDSLRVSLSVTDHFVYNCINESVINNDLDMINYIIYYLESSRTSRSVIIDMLEIVLESAIKNDNYDIVMFVLNNSSMRSYDSRIIEIALVNKNYKIIKEILTSDKLDISQNPYHNFDFNKYIMKLIDFATTISFEIVTYLLDAIKKHPNSFDYNSYYTYSLSKYKEDV